jgi:hypothetical protein
MVWVSNNRILAIDVGHHPLDLNDIDTHLKKSILEDEARILSNSSIAYQMIPQKLWPITHKDGKPGQHYHLMQIPFDAEVIVEIGYTKTYQILLHFEKTQIRRFRSWLQHNSKRWAWTWEKY